MKTVKWQKFKWSDKLAVEIVDIDADHKHLVQCMDVLFTACHEGRDTKVLAQHLADLRRYSCEHFVHEEDVMHKHKYPELQEHRAKHAQLIAALDDLIEAFHIDPELELSEQTLKFLEKWLLHHILVDDSKIGHHMAVVY